MFCHAPVLRCLRLSWLLKLFGNTRKSQKTSKNVSFVKFFAGTVLAHELSTKHEFPKTIHKRCYFPDFGREAVALEALWQDINAKNMTKSLVFVSFWCSRLDS